MDVVHNLIFWLTLLVYLFVSLALVYHWHKYTINPNVFIFSTLIYVGITAPLLLVMAISLSAM